MAEKKSDSEQLIDVYESSTGKTYDRGVAGQASREAFKTWRKSPAAGAAWSKHVAARGAPKPKPSPSPSPAAPSPKPSPSPSPEAPDAEGRTAADASRSMRSTRGVSHTGEEEAARRRNVEADAAARRAASRERYQGTAAPADVGTGGVGGASGAAAARRKKKKEEDEEDE